MAPRKNFLTGEFYRRLTIDAAVNENIDDLRRWKIDRQNMVKQFNDYGRAGWKPLIDEIKIYFDQVDATRTKE